jgi:hypothetical protein
MKSPLEELIEVHQIQGEDGNWNYDPYMQGMFNGLELALAIFEEREPNYREAPTKWTKAVELGKGDAVASEPQTKRKLAPKEETK